MTNPLFFSNRSHTINFNVMNPYWYKYVYINVFSTLGAHIGHTIRNTLRQSSWMIYGYKWDIVIINLSFTLYALKSSFILICASVSKSKPLWFVTQDKTFYRYSRYLAIKAGEFSSTLFWIRGMASNFSVISDYYFCRKSKYVFMRKDYLFDSNFSEWFLTRLAIPKVLLISSVFSSPFPVKESFKAKIGCIGLVDSNANGKICTLAVPSNDDSIDWVVFINDIFSEYILSKKLWSILRWHYYIVCKTNRFNFFDKWVGSKVSLIRSYSIKNFSKKFGSYSLFYFPLWFISTMNIKFVSTVEKFNMGLSKLNIVSVIKIFENIFSNITLSRKLIGLFSNSKFFPRPLFLDLKNFGISESNLEFRGPRKFVYRIFHDWKVNRKFTNRSSRYKRNFYRKNFFITKISFLGSFPFSFVSQRLNLLFGSSFKYILRNLRSYLLNNFFWWCKVSKISLYDKEGSITKKIMGVDHDASLNLESKISENFVRKK